MVDHLGLRPSGSSPSESDGTSLQIRTYRRATRPAAWQPATDLDALNTVQEDHPSTLTGDLLHVLIYRRAAASDRYQFVEYERASLTSSWTAVDTLPAIQGAAVYDCNRSRWRRALSVLRAAQEAREIGYGATHCCRQLAPLT